jgi:hypothetical protein
VRPRQGAEVSLPLGGAAAFRWRLNAPSLDFGVVDDMIERCPERDRLTVGSASRFSRYWNAVSKINTIATHPFGGVTTDAIGEKLSLDLFEHYRQISFSPTPLILTPETGDRPKLSR